MFERELIRETEEDWDNLERYLQSEGVELSINFEMAAAQLKACNRPSSTSSTPLKKRWVFVDTFDFENKIIDFVPDEAIDLIYTENDKSFLGIKQVAHYYWCYQHRLIFLEAKKPVLGKLKIEKRSDGDYVEGQQVVTLREFYSRGNKLDVNYKMSHTHPRYVYADNGEPINEERGINSIESINSIGGRGFITWEAFTRRNLYFADDKSKFLGKKTEVHFNPADQKSYAGTGKDAREVVWDRVSTKLVIKRSASHFFDSPPSKIELNDNEDFITPPKRKRGVYVKP